MALLVRKPDFRRNGNIIPCTLRPAASPVAVPCCPVPFAHSHCPVPWCGPVAVGRDVPIAPHRPVAVHPTPRSLRPVPSSGPFVRSLLPLPVARLCTPSPFPRALHARSPLRSPVVRYRFGRARWSTAGPPGSRPTAITPAPLARGGSPLPTAPRVPETKRASAHRWWTEARCRKDDWLA